MKDSYQLAVRWKVSPSGGRDNKPLSGRGRRNDDLDAQQTDTAIIERVDAVYDRMRVAFSEFLAAQGWSNARAYREFSPYISNPAAVTKILSGKQTFPFQVILVMAIRFNEPLDETFLGQKLETPSLTETEQKVILQLAERIKSCSDSKP